MVEPNIGASDLNNRAVNAINASTTVGAVSANNHNADGILFQGYNSSVDANNASFVVESDGSTGIGTGVAGAPLHVLSTGYPTAIIQRNHAINYPRFRLINTANDGADLDGLGDGTGGFRIACVAAGVSTERLRITSNGILLKSGQASLTSTSLPHPVQIAADSDAQNIACFGRASDDISAIDFYEADKSTLLGELQYRRDHLNLRHRVGDIVFCTGGTAEKLRINSDGKLILSGTERTTPFIVGDGGMCIEQSYDGLLKALSLRNKHTDAAAAYGIEF